MAGINLLDQLKNSKASSTNISDAPKAKMSFSFSPGSSDIGILFLRKLILFLILGGAYFYYMQYTEEEAQKLRAQTESLQQKLAKEGKKKSQMRSVGEEMKGYQARLDELQTKVKAVAGLEKNRNYLVRALDYAALEMPNSLWFNEIIASRDESQMTFSGFALNAQSVSEFIQKLESSVYFPSTTLQRLETVNGGDGPAPSTSNTSAIPLPTNARRFTVAAKLGE